MSRHQQFSSLPRRAQEYLDDLAGELGDLPRAQQQEITDNIAAHITGELTSAGKPPEDAPPADGDAATASPTGRQSGQGPHDTVPPDTVHDILDRLGPPSEIARSARSEIPADRRQVAGRDTTAIVLLLVGGFVFLIGWIVGLVMLWSSATWRLRDKIIGTVLVPGGLATPMLLSGLTAWTTTTSCVAQQPDAAQHGARCVTHSSGGLPTAVTIALFVVTIGGPLFTTIWLSIQARRTVPAAPPGMVASPQPGS